MIKIFRQSDIPVFIAYSRFSDDLKEKVAQISRAFGVEDLSSIGGLYIIESVNDWNASDDIGLSCKLKDYPVEYAEKLTYKNSHGGSETICHGCICLSNERFIDVYCPEELMLPEVFDDWKNNNL